MQNLQVLNRSEMKVILGGKVQCNAWCLHCTTPNGLETWCRDEASGNPTEECRLIYPAYGEDVSGNWGLC